MPLARVIRSGVTPKKSAAKVERSPAETGYDLVEDQKDAVPVANRPDPFQISLRGDKHSRRSGNRLDDHRGDRRGVVQGDHTLQVVGELFAVFREPARKGVLRGVVRVPDVICADQQRTGTLDSSDAAHRHAAEPRAMISTLPADHAKAGALAARPMIGDRSLHCRIDGLGTESVKDMVEAAGRKLHEAG